MPGFSACPPVEGSGIGLYMVKKIVENGGGYLDVESQLSQGSTFRVYFPKLGVCGGGAYAASYAQPAPAVRAARRR